jgi:nucleoside-diphosphate-sugar epimerase
MKILLTGSNGVVGNYLLPFLNDNPDVKEIVGISRRATYYYGSHPQKNKVKYIEAESHLEDRVWVARLISELRPDVIINLAGISTSNSPAFDIWNNNTNICLNLLENCVLFNQTVKFVQASSASAYALPLSVYAVSKLACENLVQSYSEIYDNIKAFSVVFPAVVGRGNKHGLLADLVNKIKSPGDTITLFGKYPGSKKPFIYAKNLASLINELLFDNNPSEEYRWKGWSLNICPENSLTVAEVAEIVMNKLSIHKNIIWNETKVWKGDQKEVEPMGSLFDNDRILSSEAAIKMALEDILNEAL